LLTTGSTVLVVEVGPLALPHYPSNFNKISSPKARSQRERFPTILIKSYVGTKTDLKFYTFHSVIMLIGSSKNSNSKFKVPSKLYSVLGSGIWKQDSIDI
jgi:hypothetical protein